ncbi:Inhibin beta chain [Frankliniella fusca]|uniref:Inhibin beta chain n=1 Tax=Frankliniella fusca TaxID=407009 RepID=A0AAE1HSS6_9NEOP|nr:Inhibin beta chain [Frankliniella fusca]
MDFAGHTLNGQTLLEFSLAREEEGLPIQEATLWVRVDVRVDSRRRKVADRNLTLWVFRVHGKHFNTSHVSDEDFDSYTSMAGSLSVSLSELGWKKINLTQAVQLWYAEGSGSRGRLRLLVDCSGCGELVEVNLFRPETTADDRRRPFLVVKTEPPSKRVRRRALACSGALPGECCKQELYVSFKDLGWDDWIIAPGGYRANYCRGNCSHYRTPDTYQNYHTHVLEEYRRLNKLVDMQPCCAPLRFSSMSLIYFDMDNNIIKRDLPKMVVEECGCP